MPYKSLSRMALSEPHLQQQYKSTIKKIPDPENGMGFA
jgi:hypothetical protein